MNRLFRGMLMMGLAAWGVSLLMCQHTARRVRRHTDDQLDDALDQTFPASDPTATQDFAIPANRQ